MTSTNGEAKSVTPDAAVEAAYEALDENTKLYVDWGNMRAAIEAAAPHMQAGTTPPTPESFNQMVDAVLEHAGTPRRKLFEYPHRDDDSRDMIRSAEALVRTILRG